MLRRSKLPPVLIGAFLFISWAGNVFAEEAPELVILALGDSTTAGTPGFRSPLEDPPKGSGNPESQYGHWIEKRHPHWKVLNRGVNGQRTDQILERFAADDVAREAGLVIILAGVNDLYQGQPAKRVRDNLFKLYQEAGRKGLKIMACTILPYDLASPDIRRKMQLLNLWIRTESARRGFYFCDTYKAVEDPAKPGYLAGSPDGYHPDVATYRKMGEAIADELDKFYTTNSN